MMAYNWDALTTHQLKCKKAEYLGHLETSKRRKGHNMTALRKGWEQSVKAIDAALEAKEK
jgi:hypothetical protein